jgi:hypothetical protein
VGIQFAAESPPMTVLMMRVFLPFSPMAAKAALKSFWPDRGSG